MSETGDKRNFAPSSWIAFPSKPSENLDSYVSLARGDKRCFAPMSLIELSFRFSEKF